MKKVRRTTTNNQKVGVAYKEYDAITYHCETDDTWVTVELLDNNDSSSNQ
jgi:hypothetical protein